MAGKKRRQEQKRVAVLLWMGGGGGRMQLAGIARFTHTAAPRWKFEVMQNYGSLTSEHVRHALAADVSGFILGVKPHDSRALDALVAAGLPVASIDVTDYTACRRVALVRTDDRRIGIAAADHLMSLGRFTTFGFIPDTSYGGKWSDERGQSFAARLREKGFKCSTCSIKPSEDPNAAREAVAAWVARIMKPAAVLCACDYTAARTIDVCRTMGIDVPREVVVLGVDNETICDCTTPTISSVQPDFTDEGFSAAAALDRMMCGRKPPCKVKWCNVYGIVERESTKPVVPAGRLVHDAVTFIDGNALLGIRVGDVARHLHVSRRLLDLRFRQMTGQSVLGAITKRRLAEARRLLLETRWNFTRIAKYCGLRSEDTFARLFRRHEGVPLRAYRSSGGVIPGRAGRS